MDSAGDTAEAVGCPIRKSTDQCLLAAPHGLSQRAASFIASQCQGIHQMPFRRLISTALTRRASRIILSWAPCAGVNPLMVLVKTHIRPAVVCRRADPSAAQGWN